jgi:hypothetical protein
MPSPNSTLLINNEVFRVVAAVKKRVVIQAFPTLLMLENMLISR